MSVRFVGRGAPRMAAVVATAVALVAGLVTDSSATTSSGVSLDMTSVATSSTQAADSWYPDRFPPAVFESYSYGGGTVLRHGVRTTDGASSRPGGYSSAFYNTQGRKYDTELAGDVQTMSIDVWVDSSWASQDRSLGLWATGFDKPLASRANIYDGISAYPILAFRRSQDSSIWGGSSVTAGFYGWDYQNGGYPFVSPVSTYDRWYNIKFVLTVGVGCSYFVDDVFVGSIADPYTVTLGNVILNVYNYGDEDYDVYWDNFVASGQDDDGTDTDRDGLSDLRESGYWGTSTSDRDTDDDGIDDGVEVAIGTDPLSASSPGSSTDADRDGIPDAYDNNSSSPDADNDGILDAYEFAVNGGTSTAGTPPLGDVNGSGGRPTATDANLLNQILQGQVSQGSTPDTTLDVNGDGVIDSRDVTILLNFARGRIRYLPAR